MHTQACKSMQLYMRTYVRMYIVYIAYMYVHMHVYDVHVHVRMYKLMCIRTCRITIFYDESYCVCLESSEGEDEMKDLTFRLQILAPAVSSSHEVCACMYIHVRMCVYIGDVRTYMYIPITCLGVCFFTRRACYTHC